MTMDVGGFKLVGRPALPEKVYTRRRRTDHIVIHCADTPPGREVDAEEIRGWHVRERGWTDIGYHFVVRLDGTVERGRPAWAVGAGVVGHNSGAIHICLVGGRDHDGVSADTFTDEQWVALRLLVGALTTSVAPDAEVLGHRDFPAVNKTCPSFDAREWWALEGSDAQSEAAALDLTFASS